MISQALEALTHPNPSDQMVLIRVCAEWLVRAYPNMRSGDQQRSMYTLFILAYNDMLTGDEIKNLNTKAILRLSNTICEAWTILLQQGV